MDQNDLNVIINQIIDNCLQLKDKYIHQDLVADYICIFSQTGKEYGDLIKQASKIGKVVEDTSSGPVYRFNQRPSTKIGKPYLLKIRIPDPTRPERGDVDFNTAYSVFKKKYLSKTHFNLIKREDFEMIELMDTDFNVRVYFSNKPPSKRLGIS